jgi:hypothetical protein
MNMNYNLFGAGSQGISSNTMLVGSLSFSLFDAFGNNAFSSVFISVGGNPGFGSQNLVQGTIPAQGENTSQGPWNLWQGSIPLIRDVDRGKPLPWPMEPQARLSTYAHRIDRGKPFPEPLEHNVERNPFSTLNVQL